MTDCTACVTVRKHFLFTSLQGAIFSIRISCDSPDTPSREVGNSGRSYGSVSWFPRMVQAKFNRRKHSVA